MSTDNKQIADTAQDAAPTVAEASVPIGSARQRGKGLGRKGAPTAGPVNRRVNARLNAILPERQTLWGVELNGKLPEKVAIRGLHLVKLQARRQDVVGDVAKRTLRIFNGSLKTIARTATRLEQASELAPRREAAARRPRRRAVKRRSA
ncbi:hypothetical protein EPN29_12860 [bacterium]|nr:MAG: hypothetical protein EPN29_12860 [bacterium]